MRELAPGSAVEVRTRFDGRWVGGFRVVATDGAGFRIARLSDGATLPEPFAASEVRAALEQLPHIREVVAATS